MNRAYIICPRKHGYTEATKLIELMKSILNFEKEKSDENNR